MLSIIKDKQTYFYLLLAVSIGIGLQIVVYNIAIIALLLQWFLSADYKQKFIKLKQNNFAVGLIGLYFLYALSLIWSDNIPLALTDLLLKSPMFIIPLVVLSQDKLSGKQINTILLSFSLSSISLNLFCLGDAYFSFINTEQIHEFYYSHLTINMHTAYQAMFTCLSIVFFVYLFIKEKSISSWVTYSAVAIQMIFVLLLSSRMQILIMIVIVPVYFLFYYYRKKKVVLGLLYALLIFGFAYLIITAPSSLNSRYTKTISHINSIGVDNDNSDPRKFIWTQGLEVIKNHWLIGTGVGDAKDALVDRYSKCILDNPTTENLVDSTVSQIKQNQKAVSYLKEKAINSDISYEEQLSDHAKYILVRKNDEYKFAFERNYNFHNQYLQTFGTIGLFGFLFLGFLFAYPLILSIKNKDYLVISFLFITGASFLTESMLERQAGVAFFSFFYVLLIGRISQNKPS
jgi:O-antigen ligase